MPEPRYMFEDFAPGSVEEYGGLVVDRDDMLAFAREFDPQPMHLSEEAAAKTMLGELIASGWYTAALLMRMNCDRWLVDSSSLGAPGVESVEWRTPVRAGDRLTVRSEIVAARASRSRPDMGLVTFAFDVLNQDGAVVMRQVNPVMFRRRSSGAA